AHPGAPQGLDDLLDELEIILPAEARLFIDDNHLEQPTPGVGQEALQSEALFEGIPGDAVVFVRANDRVALPFAVGQDLAALAVEAVLLLRGRAAVVAGCLDGCAHRSMSP